MPELIPGIEVDFGGGRLYTVPPLALGALQRLQGKLSQLNQASSLEPATVDAVIAATHSALVRNYPEITVEQVGDLIDVGNMHDVISSVLDVAGIKRKAIAEEKNRAAQSKTLQSPLTGQVSSQTSAPTPDGHGTTSDAT
jgi:hypothetical protein